MRSAIRAAVIHSHGRRHGFLARSLATAGWQVHDYPVARLADLSTTHPPDLLVLEGEALGLRNALGVVRYIVPRAIVIALIEPADVERRVAILGAGAQACCAPDVDVRELVALGEALVRLRWAAVPPPAARRVSWRLANGGRALAGPQGQYLPLTFTESAFFARLLAAPGHRLPREQLVAAPSPDSAQSGPLRRVDVMVSRLRAKAQRLGVDLPLLAVRQWGYIFLAGPSAECAPAKLELLDAAVDS
ncbi:response regulator transcription factor [Bordetella petrii]|uniref:response regulator transcription factor n=1 Tax=Bordetella petrii TaxID=94624 RepID=UPI001E5E61A2|nr:DNA-binding response regulator [Bordetella petrii]MCD0504449.1 DNA-binding response regulator [Bordetella petrii]